MKALITGVSGFVGTFLSKKLIEDGYDVVGLSRTPSKKEAVNYKYISCDITDSGRVEEVIKNERPDEIYHLAGTGYIPFSYQYTKDTYNTMVNGTINLYEALRRNDIDSRVLYVGSAGVYGDGTGIPFNENDLLHPNNPYAGAKACADLISEQYSKSFNMRIVRARPFNHTGPYQSSDFVCSSFARQISIMENTGSNTILVGNIDVQRDFLDVRDVVKAYQLLMQRGIPGEVYNVSSNKAVAISELLNYLLNYSNIAEPIIKIDNSKVREKDAILRVGDNSKIYLQTGWKPEYDLKETMRDTLNYWRDTQITL